MLMSHFISVSREFKLHSTAYLPRFKGIARTDEHAIEPSTTQQFADDAARERSLAHGS